MSPQDSANTSNFHYMKIRCATKSHATNPRSRFPTRSLRFVFCVYTYLCAVSASATQKKKSRNPTIINHQFIYLIILDHSRTQRRFRNFTTCRPLTGSNLKRFWRPLTRTYIQSNFCNVSRLTTVCTTFPFLKPPFRPFLGFCKNFKVKKIPSIFFFFWIKSM